ncbi:unnamed protein product [Polarella glacialis]|uniref:Uncharacterized protein n=1 Tax=Polarella glacialis TaxID=89957 RepID=A0A813H3C0_POLGL|nr:unnamed protein product [Polarella glacialis]
MRSQHQRPRPRQGQTDLPDQRRPRQRQQQPIEAAVAKPAHSDLDSAEEPAPKPGRPRQATSCKKQTLEVPNGKKPSKEKSKKLSSVDSSGSVGAASSAVTESGDSQLPKGRGTKRKASSEAASTVTVAREEEDPSHLSAPEGIAAEESFLFV